MKLLPITLLLASAGLASAASVTFSSVVATFDQGSPYNVGASIDGSTTNGFGWGVFGGQNSDQSAVYTAAAPFSGNLLSVFIPQYLGSGHYARDIRISTTTDAVPSAGGSWTEWTPSAARATHGLTMNSLGSNRYGPSGSSSNGQTGFHLLAPGAYAGVTGMRLELLNGFGSLGAAGNGNLVITEFLVSTDNTVNLALAAPVTSSAATWPGQPAFMINDGLTNTVSHPNQDAFANFSYTTNLQGVYALTSLEMVNRDNCCPDRLSNYRVEILDSGAIPVWSGDIRTDNSNSGIGGIDTITAANGTGTFAGQYIRVTNLSNQQYNPQIAELRAFGAPIPEPTVTMTGLLAAAGLVLRRRRA